MRLAALTQMHACEEAKLSVLQRRDMDLGDMQIHREASVNTSSFRLVHHRKIQSDRQIGIDAALRGSRVDEGQEFSFRQIDRL